ncbi:ABC transporter permease [Vibrio viridaestus]|uniref:ABC transporter permease n=1 Tax=Vibrio viridaestus TaxID=2487322 RepID=A0A3N9TGL3_9VIBR|nr:ABC transporter permease [Vibrio viridaestus]RQW63417.1 ABC transporter permease [Vibrio viridaestus]
MNSVIDISWLQLALFSLTLLIPFAISRHLKLRVEKDILISVTRMGVQLALVGIYLSYLFNLNSLTVNSLWLVIMMLIGAFSIIDKANLPKKKLWLPVSLGLFCGCIPVLLILCLFIVKPTPFYNTQYMIPLAGMLLGNTLSSNIIALQNLFTSFRERKAEYEGALSLGASPAYASQLFVKDAVKKAIAPILASMTTIGLVTLPGMMTGQILGGATPITAVKYQFMIMIAIFVVLTVSLLITIKMVILRCISNEGRILVTFIPEESLDN